MVQRWYRRRCSLSIGHPQMIAVIQVLPVNRTPTGDNSDTGAPCQYNTHRWPQWYRSRFFLSVEYKIPTYVLKLEGGAIVFGVEREEYLGLSKQAVAITLSHWLNLIQIQVGGCDRALKPFVSCTISYFYSFVNIFKMNSSPKNI